MVSTNLGAGFVPLIRRGAIRVPLGVKLSTNRMAARFVSLRRAGVGNRFYSYFTFLPVSKFPFQSIAPKLLTSFAQKEASSLVFVSAVPGET